MAMMDALVRYGREPEAYAIREIPIPVAPMRFLLSSPTQASAAPTPSRSATKIMVSSIL